MFLVVEELSPFPRTISCTCRPQTAVPPPTEEGLAQRITEILPQNPIAQGGIILRSPRCFTRNTHRHHCGTRTRSKWGFRRCLPSTVLHSLATLSQLFITLHWIFAGEFWVVGEISRLLNVIYGNSRGSFRPRPLSGAVGEQESTLVVNKRKLRESIRGWRTSGGCLTFSNLECCLSSAFKIPDNYAFGGLLSKNYLWRETLSNYICW